MFPLFWILLSKAHEGIPFAKLVIQIHADKEFWGNFMSVGCRSRKLDGAKTNTLTLQVPRYLNALQLSHVWAKVIGANLLFIQPFEMNQAKTCKESSFNVWTMKNTMLWEICFLKGVIDVSCPVTMILKNIWIYMGLQCEGVGFS